MKLRGLLVGCLIVVLVSSLVVACAAPAPAPALPEITWKLGCSEATHDEWNVHVVDVMADRIRDRTDGRFNIIVYVSGELGVKRELLPKTLSAGVIDMAWNCTGHIAGTFSHLGVYGLPFLVGGTEGALKDGHRAAGALHDITVREFAKLGIAPGMFFVMTPVQLISKTPVDDVSDLKGLKVRAWDEATSNIIMNMKGVPVIMSVTETYLAIQRGVVDAVLTGVPAMITQSLQELAKNMYLINLAPACVYVNYNIEAFEALPEEYQQILLEELELLEKRADEAQPIADKESLDVMAAAGVDLIEPTPEQMERVIAQVMPLWEDWAAESAINKEAYDAVMAAFGF